MNLEIYQKDAHRTCASLGSLKLDLSHMVLGIHSEYNEYIDALNNRDFINVSEELADMVWYLANYCTFRGYDLSAFQDAEISVSDNLPYLTAQLQDLVKKFVAYNKAIDQLEEKRLIAELLKSIQKQFDVHQLSMSQSLQNNINKLKVRYPEKFSQENAITRDIAKERIELER